MPMLVERHRHYALNDDDSVAQLEHDYRKMLHGRRPDKLELRDQHIRRHEDKAHVAAVTDAYRGIRGYSNFDAAHAVPEHNTARLVLEATPQQMVAALGDDIDRANWAGWTCLHMASWYGSLPHVEALLAAPRAASALRPSAREFTLPAGCTHAVLESAPAPQLARLCRSWWALPEAGASPRAAGGCRARAAARCVPR